MQIEIGKKYRVIDESRFMPEHEIKNGDEFVVHGIDEDGDLYSRNISWEGKLGNDKYATSEGWALLLNERGQYAEEYADYTGSIEVVEEE